MLHSDLSRSHRLTRSAWIVSFALLFCAAASAPVVAQQAGIAAQAERPVSINMLHFKVVKGPNGKERLIAAERVAPGDILEYRATYHNNVKRPVSGLVANLPIPQGTIYLPGSASSPKFQVEAAAADGNFAPEPLMRTITGADGKPHLVPLPYGEYRSLRWRIGQIGSGNAVTVKARVRIAGYGGATG